MEDASKALIIAGSVLLSLMIISLLVYFGNNIGILAKGEERVEATAQVSAFNKEYEIYEKSLMYGTDVLSCLNKAQNNNQKYVNNNHYGTDNLDYTARDEYLINVEVTIKNTVEEKIEIYKTDTSSGRKIIVTENLTGNVASIKPFKTSSPVHFKLPNVVWYFFSNNGKVTKQTGNYINTLWKTNLSDKSIGYFVNHSTIQTKLSAGTHKLFNNGSDDGQIGILTALLSTATTVEQTLINPNPAQYGSDWYSVVWTTAAYDFKTRKFKCTGLEYNEETSRISSIKFEEIDT